jgi:Pentapeptide repeats (9 copies)
MKSKIYLFSFLYFVFSLTCLGQVNVLNLPSNGVYVKPLTFKNKSIRIERESEIITDSLKITNIVIFVGTKFQNTANFNSSTFQNDVYSKACTFQNDAEFMNSTFQKQAYFDYSTFQERAYFDYSTFQKESIFHNSHFQGFTTFENSNFQNITDFRGSVFQYLVNFKGSVFQNIVSFKMSEFHNQADFSGTIFNYYNGFQQSLGNVKFIFTDAQMPNILNFSYIDSIKIDFRDVRCDSLLKRKFLFVIDSKSDDSDSLFYKTYSKLFFQSKEINKCVIQLKGTNLSNIILPHDRFWVDTTGYSYEEKASLYEKLIKVCKEEGMDESIEGWSIELKKAQNLHYFPRIGWFLNWFQNVFWGFGFSKWYILIWIFSLFTLFFLVNLFIYPQLFRVYFNPKLGLNLFPSTPPDTAENLIVALRKNSAIRFRYLLHYTGVIFFALKLEHADVSFKHLRWVAVVYFQFVTGIVLLGFAINFILSK